jgi:anti-anti-sigma factor
MGIQEWSENVLLVSLAPEPDMCEELKTITDMVRQRKGCSVVVDFSEVDIVTSSSLAQLLKLQKMLDDNDQQFVVCGMSKRTKSIFDVTGLDKVFEFVQDKFTALAGLQIAS